MVSIQNELAMKEVMTPMLDSLDDGIKLNVIRVVAKTRV